MSEKSPNWPLLLASWLALVSSGCSGERGPGTQAHTETAPTTDGRLFTKLPSSYTGVSFENRVTDSKERNVFTYRNHYNGGGVALGDLTGDGLPEIVLTANQGGARLYLNEGNFRFRDITERAGLGRKAPWTTGVVMADVNGDGRLDIYISHAGLVEPKERANALWINEGTRDGVPIFAEQGRAYGIADEGYTTHAVFFDYDRDGDLDLFLINNSPRPANSFGLRNTRHVRDQYGGHKLYRNDGAHFTDVSEQAGIFGSEIGFGLGVGVGDVNRDGWPDVYVANDFFENDYLYINKGDGTFSESLESAMPVVSYFSMGMDIADLDGDGWPDIYTTDMMPEDEYRLRTTSAFEGWDVYQAKVRNGYHHQFMRNMLQRNNGNGTFSDVGQMAGVARTDWSWSALIADFDLDGRKDVFVTNGLARDVTSQDYVAFLANDERVAQTAKGGSVDFLRLVNAMGSTPLPNYAFRNLGNLTFSNEAAAWGLDTPTYSNGAAYGDLDGDGTLDLVVNNVNQEAFVYRNNARSLLKEHHFLQVKLEGEQSNRFGVGARVTLKSGGEIFFQELYPSRGFQSSVDYVLTFGLGNHGSVDSLRVDWPDGRVSVQTAIVADQRLTIRQSEGVPAAPARVVPEAPLLADVTDRTTLPFVHRENDFVDFDRERLIPKMLSTEGPLMAVADVNGDRLDDIYIGGAKDQPGRLLIQRANGEFVPGNPGLFEIDQVSEDAGALFFDANGDGHPDLYVVSGGSEYSDMAPALQDRLYLNDGRGNFRKTEGYLPTEAISGSRVVAADFDGDGDLDLFVGGRSIPWQYGADPQSQLLRNDGSGRFADVTDNLAPGLSRVGMVTDAVWQDVDGDGRVDLVVAGEWMPIAVFRNTGNGRLTRLDVPGLAKSDGWWNRIVATDVNGDGHIDFVLGNLGLNSRLRTSETEPATMYVKDFDGNGFVEQIVATYGQGRSYPLALRDELIKAIPPLKVRFLNYKDYARQSVTDIFPKAVLDSAVMKSAYTFASAIALNNGNGSFTLVPLPREAQLAPVYGILARDIDQDGITDLLLAGNFDGFKPDIGRMSAIYGLALRGDGKGGGGFTPMKAQESGFLVRGQARDIARLRTRDGERYIVSRNNDRPLVFRPTHREPQ